MNKQLYMPVSPGGGPVVQRSQKARSSPLVGVAIRKRNQYGVYVTVASPSVEIESTGNRTLSDSGDGEEFEGQSDEVPSNER